MTVIAGAQTTATFTNTVPPIIPTTGSIQVCKVAGSGVAVGTNFSFNVAGTPVTIPAGAAPSGSCSAALTLPAGPAVITETIAGGNVLTSVSILPSAALVSSNLSAGTATVTVIAGAQTTAVFTNAAVFVSTRQPDDAYQLHYLANLDKGDGVINITNAGALGGDAFGPGAGTTGRICVNVYAFTPGEQEMACCSCLVTPNALVHLSASTDLLPNTLSLSTPTSIVVKLLATIPLSSTGTGGTNTGPFTGSTCNAASPFDTTNLAPGLQAWATTLHALPSSPVTYGVTESRFQPAVLSAGELNKLTTLCRFIVSNGSGAGICHSCTLGGLGADKR